MKIRVSITISDPDVEDFLTKLGAYRRSVFIKEAIRYFCGTEKGMKLFNRLMHQKKKTDDKFNLDDLL